MMKLSMILSAAIALGMMTTLIVETNRDKLYTSEEVVAFEKWNTEFKKAYNCPAEKLYRLAVFIKNLRDIQASNKVNANYRLGLNHMSTFTEEEFAIKFLGRKGRVIPDSERVEPERANADPMSVNWLDKGYVTPVKDQGQCGSCWAFSSTGSLEAEYFGKYGELISFSESQLVDCSTSFGNQGCNGGLQENAYKYLTTVGEETESDYPYTPKDGSCKFDKTKVKSNINGYTAIQKGQAALKQGLINRPLAVSVYAKPWLQYQSGIYDNHLQCPAATFLLDHAVLLVGYGTDNGKDYWLVKNSWSTQWGEKGYIRLDRGTSGNGICGIALEALYPNIK